MKQNNFRASSQKSLSVKAQKSSKVLFVTIYDPIVFELTNDLIFSTFNEYGKVKKVLIFEKGEATKFFVEFQTIEDSQNAKANLQGKMLHNNYCKMHIFYSKISAVDLKNKNSQGRDYSSIQTQKNNQIKNNFDIFQNIKTQKKTSDDFSLFKFHSTEALDFSKYKTRANTEGAQLEKAINAIRKQQQGSQKDEIGQIIYRDIQNILQEKEQDHFDQFEKKVRKKIHYDQSEIKYDCINESIISKNQTEVIYFNFQQKISLMEVYNLFSNYGNIQKVVMKNSIIYIQFTNLQFSIIAKDYLQNIVLCSNIIRLNFGNKADLIEKHNQYSERITFDDSYHRFNSVKSIAINPPSRVLHLSNLKKQICNPNSLTQIFNPIAKVQKIQILYKSDEKNMALAKFFSMEDSVKVISQMHNQIFNERKMQISFTKSKI